MGAERLDVKKEVLSANDQLAAAIRDDFAKRRILSLNLISSPGSGKTTLLEETIDALKSQWRLAVIAGDVQTRNDAERLIRRGVPVQAIETGGGCHLNAEQVTHALEALDRDQLDLLLIENVGNLVCPSSFDLGESMKVVFMSVTEGEDKPLKYPAAFRRAGALVLTKTDLIPHLRFSPDAAIENARSINPDLRVFSTSSYTGAGLDDWLEWLTERVEERRRGA